MNTEDQNQFAKCIDLDLFHRPWSDNELVTALQQARATRIAAVCVPPYAVEMAFDALLGSKVAVSVAVDFPDGGSTTSVRSFAIEQALSQGAKEVELAVNVGKTLTQDWAFLGTDLGAIVSVANEYAAKVKLVATHPLLAPEHKITLCKFAEAMGFAFVQANCTGVDDDTFSRELRLLRENMPARVALKASGVHNWDRVLLARAWDAARIGTEDAATLMDAARR